MVWKEFVSVFVQEFAVAVVVALAPVVVGVLVALFKKLWAQAEAKIDSRFMGVLNEAVRIAVLAAEQAKLAGHIETKKAYAIDIAQRYLEVRGFKIDLALVSDRIEAAVMEEFNKAKLVEGAG